MAGLDNLRRKGLVILGKVFHCFAAESVLLFIAAPVPASTVDSITSADGTQRIVNSLTGLSSGGNMTGMTVRAIYDDPSLNETAIWAGSGASGGAIASSGN